MCGPFCSTPPTAMMMVVLPACSAALTSAVVRSSRNTLGAIEAACASKDVLRAISTITTTRTKAVFIMIRNASLVEPDCTNALANHLIDSDHLNDTFLKTCYALVINDRASSDHAIDDFCVKVWQREPVLRVVSSKGLFA